jgi:hypothetical protein
MHYGVYFIQSNENSSSLVRRPNEHGKEVNSFFSKYKNSRLRSYPNSTGRILI